ncbi:sugar phosphate nucleotidyltransferase [Streptomyces sp900116325]|uniref:sugar phosphate nucleotidyltransferase n=1 Tax=Streptomyces sp. 900116325 TaxID=3154295 RepID=UPI0033B3D4A0
MSTTIRRAVIPAAGLGSRLLPLTKATPKEMLPVGDKPVIEHTVRELVASGVTDITIVVSGGKGLIQDHFRPNLALVAQLRADGRNAYADAVEEVGDLSRRGHITYLDQHGPYGNGTPVLNAARNLGDEPMLVLWPDDVFVAGTPRAQQLIKAYEATSCPVLALMPVTPPPRKRGGFSLDPTGSHDGQALTAAEAGSQRTTPLRGSESQDAFPARPEGPDSHARSGMDPADSHRYGVPVVKEDLNDGLLRITGLVEKPQPQDAPSAYAAIGGYVVTLGIVDELLAQEVGETPSA